MASMSTMGPDEVVRPREQPSQVESPPPAAHTLTPPLLPPRPARSTAVSPERCAGILDTLQEISAATADIEGCRRLLERVAHELQAEQGVLILCNPLTREMEFVVHNQDPAVPKRYAEYYGDLDPTGLPDFVKGNTSLPASFPALAVSDLMDVVDYRSLVSTEFYNDFFKSAGIHYDLVAFMSATPLARGVMSLHRARDNRPFSAQEVAILDMIAPFVGNHLEKIASASVLTVLDAAGDKGVIVSDINGRVLYSNDIARELCFGVGRPDGTQGAAGPRDVMARSVDEASFVGYALSDLDALAERLDLQVHSRDIILDQGVPGRLITLDPRGGSARAWAEPLKERFGLSDREIEVLNRVIAGGGNREIAQALFIAECTVKKHMQSIAAKVGARSRTAIAHAVRQELGLNH